MTSCFRLSAVLLVLGMVIPFHGCRPAPGPGEERPASGKSSVALLADGITGNYAVDAGKRATADIHAIAERQDAKLAEILEE